MTKPPLPPITTELVPRPRVDLNKLKSRGPSSDEVVEENSLAIGQAWGASVQIAQPKPTIAVAPIISIRGYIPVYLDEELARIAFERKVTKTFLIMEALAKSGYHVDKADLIPDRRKSRQSGKDR